MINIEPQTCTIVISDLGVTLRTLLACAVTGYKSNPKRTWKVQYKSVVIASVRIKTDGTPSVGPVSSPKYVKAIAQIVPSKAQTPTVSCEGPVNSTL